MEEDFNQTYFILRDDYFGRREEILARMREFEQSVTRHAFWVFLRWRPPRRERERDTIHVHVFLSNLCSLYVQAIDGYIHGGRKQQ